MIYTKEASFPYPIYSNLSHDFDEPIFDFDINVTEHETKYDFNITYNLGSSYIKNLIDSGKTRAILIIKSIDSQFYFLGSEKETISIMKNQISLDGRTTAQIHIQALSNLSYQDNDDLSKRYYAFRDEILINRHCVIGYSGTIEFDGSDKEAMGLFEYSLDPSMKKDFKIEITQDNVLLVWKNPKDSITGDEGLLNLYLYLGLSGTLIDFLTRHSVDPDSGFEVFIDNVAQSPGTVLDKKITKLLQNRGITELYFENIDEAIFLIADSIIPKFTQSIERRLIE